MYFHVGLRGGPAPVRHTAKLYGHVHSMREANAAKAAAAAAPGIAEVESHLVVTP